MKKNHLKDYSPEFILRLKALAKKLGAEDIAHILPRALCIAKPTPHCAVFSVPPQDREPQIQTHTELMVENASAAKAEKGSWHSLAYLHKKNPSRAEMFVLK